ncbi:hypothetical protein C8R45DRAFT_1032646 [Mycena sanguinolenta]|nr:hypothetical protein C8R45DRAFT_1032646 [Mycena sanguinolenta]
MSTWSGVQLFIVTRILQHLHQSELAMTSLQTLSKTSILFSVLCILSAAPFVGIPFPSRAAAEYYRDKSAWMAATVFGNRITPTQAGYLSSVGRVLIGAGLIYPPTREATLLVNGAIVSCGTVMAIRGGRLLLPQFGMLAAVAWCLVLGRLADSA